MYLSKRNQSSAYRVGTPVFLSSKLGGASHAEAVRNAPACLSVNRGVRHYNRWTQSCNFALGGTLTNSGHKPNQELGHPDLLKPAERSLPVSGLLVIAVDAFAVTSHSLSV